MFPLSCGILFLKVNTLLFGSQFREKKKLANVVIQTVKQKVNSIKINSRTVR